MRWPGADDSDALHARVRAAIAATAGGGTLDGAMFDALALDLAHHQQRHVAPFARLVRARGVDLDAARSADAIPAVPTDVFRLARIAAHPPEDDVRTFRTSGTTSGARGALPLRTTATYAAGAIAWGARHLWPAHPPPVDLRAEPGRPLRRAVVLGPRAADVPDSSLSFMIDLFVEHLGADATWHVDPARAALDHDGLARACDAARGAGEPVLLFGTGFAFVWATDTDDLDLRLPPGSRAMITGGFKGKTREVDEAELRARLADRFALAPSAIVGEYGMTELSSQLYQPRLIPGATHPERYRAPPWVRVTAVDPTSLEPVAPGEVGLARIVDLANVDNAVALQTADRVRVVDDEVELLGRAPGATPRGCSIAIEEMQG